MSDYFVYVLYREDRRPFYVGKGRGWRLQVSCRAVGKSPKASIIRRMLANGLDVPRAKIAEGLSENQAFFFEQWLIYQIGRKPNGPLVNRTDGGEGASGRAIEIETRTRIAEKLRGRKRGRTLTPAGAAALREKHTGSKRTPEQRAKMSAAQRGNKNNLGKALSTETRQKIAAAHRGKTKSVEAIAQRSTTRRLREKAKANWFWKSCRACGIEKPLTTEFWLRHKQSVDGFGYRCVDCLRADDRERYARQKR